MHLIQYTQLAFVLASTAFASHMDMLFERAPCVTGVAVPKPAEYHCGAKLDLQSPKLISHSENETLAACRTRCLVDEHCISFGHSPHQGSCHAFSDSLHQMGATHGHGDMEYYNRHCFATSGDCSPPEGHFTGTMTITVLSTTTVTHLQTVTSATG